MLHVLLTFVGSATVIVFAAVTLTKYADVIATRTRLGRLLVGSLFLAGATSLPELTIDYHAIQLGLPDMAIGGLLGSSLFNLLILAIADLVHHTRGRLFSRTAASHSLSGTVSIALTAIVGMAIFVEAEVGGVTFWRFGLGAIALGLAYLFGMRLVYFNQRAKVEHYEVPEAGYAGALGVSLWRAGLGYLVATIVILLAAPYLASSAGTLAELTQLGDTFIGTTLVAFATSLPELVTTIAAVRIGAIDLAIGNIFGSNTFNIMLIIPLDALTSTSLLGEVSTIHLLTCFAVCLTTSVVILGQLYRVERRVLFFEPDAALVIALVVGAFWLIYLAT